MQQYKDRGEPVPRIAEPCRLAVDAEVESIGDFLKRYKEGQNRDMGIPISPTENPISDLKPCPDDDCVSTTAEPIQEADIALPQPDIAANAEASLPMRTEPEPEPKKKEFTKEERIAKVRAGIASFKEDLQRLEDTRKEETVEYCVKESMIQDLEKMLKGLLGK